MAASLLIGNIQIVTLKYLIRTTLRAIIIYLIYIGWMKKERERKREREREREYKDDDKDEREGGGGNKRMGLGF